MLLRTYVYKLLSLYSIIWISKVEQKTAPKTPNTDTKHFAYWTNIWYMARKISIVGDYKWVESAFISQMSLKNGSGSRPLRDLVGERATCPKQSKKL